jgi:hypothetical protein
LEKPINEQILKKRIDTLLEVERRKEREKELKDLLSEAQEQEKEYSMKLSEMAAMKKKVQMNIETPMSIVIDTISKIMESKLDKENMKLSLVKVLDALGTSDLYKPAFADYLKNDVVMDPEIRQWLSIEFTTEKNSFISPRISKFSRRCSEISLTDSLPFKLSELKPKIKLDGYGFDVFQYSKTELRYFFVYMMKSLNYFDKFMISPSTFWRLLLKVEKCYNDNIYHNFYHCFDVTQYIYALISDPSISSIFNDMDKLTLLLSALFHDTDHPGLNNNYLINSRDDLSLIYNGN